MTPSLPPSHPCAQQEHRQQILYLIGGRLLFCFVLFCFFFFLSCLFCCDLLLSCSFLFLHIKHRRDSTANQSSPVIRQVSWLLLLLLSCCGKVVASQVSFASHFSHKVCLCQGEKDMPQRMRERERERERASIIILVMCT